MKEDFSEIELGTTVESFQKFLESQHHLFHHQIDQLRHIVITQCQLTGINPLAQEMAAGALSINIGKRPRDLLNPKAVKYMQSVFAIKDAVSKKESREISALFGITVGQVRDFFVSQRMRVRKIVRLSNEKSVIKSKDSKKLRYEVQTSNDPISPIDPVPLNVIGPTGDEEVSLNTVVPRTAEFVLQNAVVTTSSELPPSTYDISAAEVVPLNTIGPTSSEIVPLNTVYPNSPQLVPLNTVDATSMEPIALSVAGPAAAKEGSSCSTQDDSEKHFVENIFNLMRKEESFSGQVKLMERILRMRNSSVLYWFLTQGGVMMLASWLSEAANEEQTSVLSVILKVLCHLPMHKALPVHMSVILQSVNQLRFYRMSDISNRARVLLSRWSKVFARSQALRRSNGVKSSSDTQKDIMLTQSISEIMSDESWQSKLENIDGNQVALYETSDDIRKQNPLKLLTSSNDDSSRKNILGISSKTKGRRKVQLVEQPGQRLANRSQQVSKTVSSSQSRPMSTDDIQKAKMRAQFMQSKYGKNGSSSSGTVEVKPEVPNKLENQPAVLPPVSKVESKTEEHKKHVVPQNAHHPGASAHPNISMNLKEPFWKQCQRVQIPWQAPPEIRINDDWTVGAGENSKEIEVQRSRIRRERETIYQTLQEIPPNPKSPWDTEMDYDDTLTPVVPIEQLPDAETPKTEISSPPVEYENRAQDAAPATVMSQGSSNASTGGGPGPDLELLAVLLKNPDLVFALTSGQAGNLSSEDMVRLLDAIKSNGAGLLGNNNNNLNGVNGGGGGMGVGRVEVSLPSPTPPSNPGTSGWRPEVVKNPFSKQSPVPAEHYSSLGGGAASSYGRASLASSVQPAASLPQQFQSAVPPYSLPQRHNILPENRQPFITPQRQNSPVHPILHSPTPHVEAMNNVKPQVSIVTNMLDNRSPVSFSLPTLFSQQLSIVPEPQRGTQSYAAAIPVSNHDSMLNAYRTRQRLASNPSYQVNQNIHGHVSGSREDKEHVSGDDYESWEPPHSPSRNRGSNNPEYRSSYGLTYRPDWSRQQQFSSGYRDHGRDGNRSWRGGDRRR